MTVHAVRRPGRRRPDKSAVGGRPRDGWMGGASPIAPCDGLVDVRRPEQACFGIGRGVMEGPSKGTAYLAAIAAGARKRADAGTPVGNGRRRRPTEADPVRCDGSIRSCFSVASVDGTSERRRRPKGRQEVDQDTDSRPDADQAKERNPTDREAESVRDPGDKVTFGCVAARGSVSGCRKRLDGFGSSACWCLGRFHAGAHGCDRGWRTVLAGWCWRGRVDGFGSRSSRERKTAKRSSPNEDRISMVDRSERDATPSPDAGLGCLRPVS